MEALDQYVWREAARCIRAWKDQYGYSVPVSVNVSRVDLNDPNITYTLLSILEEYRLDPGDLHLEVTESAYSRDTEQIIDVVKRLRALGFEVEMDDFGTGYSSLNMLSKLPIDILKLDMKFIQTAPEDEKTLDMLSIIIDIARHISTPVVAEGVETDKQLQVLRELGCDIVQGYYFSPPVPFEKFDAFLIERKNAREAEEKADAERRPKKALGGSPILTGLSEKYSFSMHKSRTFFLILAVVAAAALMTADAVTTRVFKRMDQAGEQYILARQCAADLEIGSDELTADVRSFVATGDMEYLDAYFREAEVTRHRENAVRRLRELVGNREVSSLGYLSLSKALDLSNELMEQEYLAMNLVLADGDHASVRIPEVLSRYPLTDRQKALSAGEKKALAQEMVYGSKYKEYKDKIAEKTGVCMLELIKKADKARLKERRTMSALLPLQIVLTLALLFVVLLIVIFISTWILDPLLDLVARIKSKSTAKLVGAREMRYVSETYNHMFDENRRTHERLTYGNMHDALTGLYNRSAYDFMRYDLKMDDNALLLVDVDKFKSVNDTYGHEWAIWS